MQRQVLKKIVFPGVIILLFNLIAPAQNYHLTKADSLFQQKRYTQSLELYKSIFAQSKYTPAMFLKMAYVEEGLGNVSASMYYLNLYYLASRDESVVTKINEVADKYRLTGYTFSDQDRILGKYNEFHVPITIGLISLSFFFLSVIIYQHSKKNKPVGSAVAMFFTLVILFIHSNLQLTYSSAIIASPNTYVMSGPSAGASVVRILEEGHRVKVYGHTDVWIKIRLNNSDLYIKQDHVLPILL